MPLFTSLTHSPNENRLSAKSLTASHFDCILFCFEYILINASGRSQARSSHFFCLGTLEGDNIFVCYIFLLFFSMEPWCVLRIKNVWKFLPLGNSFLLFFPWFWPFLWISFTPTLLSPTSLKSLTLTCYTAVVNGRHQFTVFKNHLLPHTDGFSPVLGKKVIESKRLGIWFLNKDMQIWTEYAFHCGHLPSTGRSMMSGFLG